MERTTAPRAQARQVRAVQDLLGAQLGGLAALWGPATTPLPPQHLPPINSESCLDLST